MARKKRILTQAEMDYIFSLKTEDVSLQLMKDLFGNTAKGEARFLTNDFFTLPAGKMYNKEAVLTTIGRYVYNLFMLSPKLIEHTGYINYALSSKNIDKVEDRLSQLLLDDKITPEDFIEYINKAQWMGFSAAIFMAPSLSYAMSEPRPDVDRKKRELEKKYAKEIAAGDPKVASAMEKELVPMAEQAVKDLPAYEIFDSGTSKGFGNNYKNVSIMRGAIADNAVKGKYTVSTSNLFDGIPKEDYHAFADMPVQASYARAIETQQGGYMSKQLSAAFQTIVLDKQGSNCGTKKTVSVQLTSKNKDSYLYRYVVKGGGLVLLDEDSIGKYVDTLVEMRSPLFCTSEKTCSKCAGDLYYRLGIQNVGLLTSRVGSRIMNLALKKFHDTTLKYNRIDVTKFIE